MLRYLSIPLLCICGAFVTAAPRDFGILGGKARVGSGSGYVNGITATTLYDGYWDPGQPIIHKELDGSSTTLSAVSRDWTDYDPQKADSSLTWFYDVVANRSNILATLTRLQTEWSTESQKYGGSFTNSYYVDWSTGNDSTGDGSSGNKWKTLDKAIDYIKANHTDGSNLLDAATQVVLSAGVQYIDQNGTIAGTGEPSGGFATVEIDNIIGSSTKPLVIRGATGNREDVIVRIDHTYLSTFFDDFADDTYFRDTGINLKANTDYVQIWDLSLIGPMFEMPYRDGEGDSCGFWSSGVGASVNNNKVINCEIAQWLHGGIKGDGIYAYGNYIHTNGITFHDWGFYVSKNRDNLEIEGNIIINSYAGAISPREQSAETGMAIRGNILGYSKRPMDPGAYGMEISHNLFIGTDEQFIQLGGRTRAARFDNNIFYGDISVVLMGVSGSYIRPVSYVWRTNANNSGVTIPSSPPAISAHPGSGVAMSDQANIREANGHAYAVFPGGDGTTGATAPTHTDGSSVSDGGVTWTDIGTAAESYGTWTTIDADDFADFANFDFRPATVSDLKSNGTDIGYGTTIGPFQSSP